MFNITDTCPYTNWVTTARKSCTDPDRYHCLRDEFSRLGWICADPIWVEGGRCPEFNSVAKKMDTIECSGSDCPDSNYQSTFAHIYQACRAEETKMTTSSASTMLATPKANADDDAVGIIAGITVGVVLVIIAAVLAFIYLRRKQRQSNSGDPEEGQMMLDVPEPGDLRSYPRAQRALHIERFVIILGIQGAGKTFLAKQLCGDGLQKDCLWITDPDAFPANPEYRKYFVVDDVFHELQTEDKVRDIRSKLDDLYEKVIVKGRGCIILTITSVIRKRYSALFEERKYQNVIDLDHLCAEDREEILQYHMKLNKIVMENENQTTETSLIMRGTDYKIILSVKQSEMGYPSAVALCCKIDNQEDFNKYCGRAIKTPMSWLHSDLKEMINSDDVGKQHDTIALSLIVLQGGELDKKDINQELLNKLLELENVQSAEELNLDQTLSNLKRKFVEENDGVYKFQIPIVMKVVFKIICEKHSELLDFCGKHLLERRVCKMESFPADIPGDYAKSFLKQQKI